MEPLEEAAAAAPLIDRARGAAAAADPWALANLALPVSSLASGFVASLASVPIYFYFYDVLGLGATQSEGRGDGIGNVRATERNGEQPDQHAAGIERDIGNGRAHLDQRDAQLPRCQHAQPKRAACAALPSFFEWTNVGAATRQASGR